MSAQLDSSSKVLRQGQTHLRVEFGHSSFGEIAEAYRAMAVSCIRQDVTRVLIVIGDGDREGEQALRDAMTMMVLAGLPTGFRLALVAHAPRARAVYRNARSDFNAAGVSTRMFDSEADAAQWLET